MMTAAQLERAAEPQPERATNEPIELPDEVTSPPAKLVYLYLLVRGTVTVDELGASLGLPKLTLFSILQTLAGYGLVVRDGDDVSPA
ncbi:helix-turn-helix domain-containing protein [Salinigranum sp.]|uniref:helix-turn-helix domain-containing protein n=1 Tax=Salinigranum sp. TaxID=1966351 RepID=UPI003564307B